MVTLPDVTPVTTPVVETVATAGLLVVQAPPAAVSAKVIVEPIQTLPGPVIVPALTVGVTPTV
jgi:hypothetical protein